MARGAKVVITAEDKTRAALDSASGGFGKLQAHASSMSTGMGLAMAGAGVALAAFAKSSVEKYEQVGSETIKLSRLTGGTAQDMSALRVQAQMSGVPFDTLAKSITIFAKGLEAGKPAKAMADLGIAIHDTSGHTRGFQDMLGDLADKFHDMPNGLDKTRLATELFGRSGADMEPLLNKGSGALADITSKAKDLGLILDGSAKDAMADHIQKQRELGLAMDGVKVSLGEALMPVLETATGVVSKVAGEFAKLPGPVKDIAVYGAGAAVAITGIISGMKFGAGVIGDMKNGLLTLKGALTGAEGGLTSLGSTAAGLGAAGAGVAVVYLGIEAEHAQVKVKGLTDAVGGIANDVSIKSIQTLNAELDSKPTGFWSHVAENLPGATFLTDLNNTKDAVGQMNDMIAQNPAQAEKLIGSLERSGKSTGLFGDSLDDLKKRAHEAALKQDEQKVATDNQATATDNAVISLSKYSDALKAQTDPLFAVIDAGGKWKDAQWAAFGAQTDVNNAVKMFGENSPAAVQATAALDKANQDAVLSAQGFDGALGNLATKVGDGSVKLGDAKGALDRWVAQGYITKDQADAVAKKFDLVAAAAQNAAGTYTISMELKDLASNGIATLAGRVGQFFGGPVQTMPIKKKAAGGPVSAGTPYIVGEVGQELFVPSTSGTIIPNNALGGGNTYKITVNAGVGNPQEIGATIVDMVRQYERTNGTSWRN